MAGEIATVLLARRFEARMAEADKMRMAGVLSAGIAHNFNNLLQAIIGQASLVDMQAKDNALLKQAAQMIQQTSNRGAQLIRQMQAFALPRPAALQPIKLNDFLNNSRELYRGLLGTEIALNYQFENAGGEISIESAQLQQVMTIILVNAKEAIATKGNGKVNLALRRVRLQSGEIDPELAPGEYLRLDIEDNGVGMTPQQQARCFEPFFSTKNVDRNTGLSFTGAGLGLSVAYAIMRQNEGLITVNSALGEGATFSIYLPLHKAGAPGTLVTEPKADCNGPARLSKQIEIAATESGAKSNKPGWELDAAVVQRKRTAEEGR
jgi:two-component system cell cycle sensor histidine kinase/response regulator CckA